MLRLDPVSKCLISSIQLPPDLYILAECLLTAHKKTEPLPPDDAAYIIWGDDIMSDGQIVDTGEIHALASELTTAISKVSRRQHIQTTPDGYTLDPLGQETSTKKKNPKKKS